MNDADSPDALDWAKSSGLIPAIVQDAHSGRVLMLGYMNREALKITRTNGWVTFFSRSRQCLWTKGETSGNRLKLVAVHADCDADTLLVLAEPTGPVCHTGAAGCFDGIESPLGFLADLDRLIAERHRERPAASYTTELFARGTRRIAQKLGEEAVETALAAVAEPDEAFLGEAADLLYHLLVLLRARGMDLFGVLERLHTRHNDKEGGAVKVHGILL